MTAELVRDLLVSPEDYLEGELVSEVKHEFIAGFVYAMAGAKNLHNEIATNILGVLHGILRGKKCRPYNSDTKVRIRLPSHLRFYYPDVQVTCQPNAPEESYQDQPVVVIEVISESTRRTDEGEKREGYLSIPSLENYLLVETERALVVCYRRTATGFAREIYPGLDAVIPLACLEAELRLAEVYDRVSFPPA